MQTQNLKIISTLGPSSLNPKFIKMVNTYQQSHFRLNFSHLSIKQLVRYLNFVEKHPSKIPPIYYLDLPGKKIRIGGLKNPILLKNEAEVEFIPGDLSEHEQISLPSETFFKVIEANDVVLLQDGSIKMKVISTSRSQCRAKVIRGGKLRSKAGVRVENKNLKSDDGSGPSFRMLKMAEKRKINYLALSYVTVPSEITDLQKTCADLSYFPKIIAKIEHPLALDHLEAISETADEIWYCRGDLGTFISPAELSRWQDQTIKIAKKHRKPIIIAGQVFQYLTDHSTPTRTEVVHFMKLIEAGVNGIVLSDETAIGKNSEKAAEAVFSLLKDMA